MAISNMKHVGEGRTKFVLKSGEVVRADVMHNDRTGEFLGLEIGEGGFGCLPYAAVNYAVSLSRLVRR